MNAGRIETCEVVLQSQKSRQESLGKVQIQFWNPRERLRRALKFGAMCWGFALVAVLIPIVHFFLVPTLLLSGPIVAWVVSRQSDVILGGAGRCPECRADMKIVRSALQWPLKDLCTSCKTMVTIAQNNAGASTPISS